MRSKRPEPAYLASNAFALLTTAVIFTVLVLLRPVFRPPLPAHPDPTPQAAIEVSLQAAPVEPAPAAPAAPMPAKVKAHVAVLRTVPVQAASEPAIAAPTATPVAAEAIPEGGAVIASSSVLPTAASTSEKRTDLEAQYAAGLRADIDHRTKPPDTLKYRLQHPSGEVRVGFVVLRSGESRSVHVLRSSGSELLDEAAVGIVSTGHYPPMPAQLFAGEMEHVFAVTIEFRATS